MPKKTDKKEKKELERSKKKATDKRTKKKAVSRKAGAALKNKKTTKKPSTTKKERRGTTKKMTAAKTKKTTSKARQGSKKNTGTKKKSTTSAKKNLSKNSKRVVVKKKKAKLTNGNATKIKVVGVGGCGGNIATRLYDEFPRGVDVIVINTDLQDLSQCRANKKLYIGKQTTRGLGAGMDPEIGRKSAEENREEISNALAGADMVFITAGFGGGTGSGAAPVVAEIAKEMGILTIGVVTKPFYFEGALRSQIASDAIDRMKERVDTLIEISNDRIFSVINPNSSVTKAFAAIDEILKNAVGGIAEMILYPGLINVDFADIKYVMQHSGPAIIGVGVGSGKNRAAIAATRAINSPLLEESIDGARGLLFSVSGRKDMKMSEINEIAKIVSENINPAARIIFGAYYDRKIPKGGIKVTIIATGLKQSAYSNSRNIPLFGILENIDGNDIMNENEEEEIFENVQSEKMKKLDFERAKDKNEQSGARTEDEEDMTEDSFWDIPTFLRKKKRKK